MSTIEVARHQSGIAFLKAILLASFFFGTTISFANEWVCQNGQVTRSLTIEYQTGRQAPCRVLYDKSMEGEGVRELWNARSEVGYCERRTNDVVSQLRASGWNCNQTQTAKFISAPKKSSASAVPQYARPYIKWPLDGESGIMYRPGFFVSVPDYLAMSRDGRIGYVAGVIDIRLNSHNFDLMSFPFYGEQEAKIIKEYVRNLDTCVRKYSITSHVANWEKHIDDHGLDKDDGGDEGPEDMDASMLINAYLIDLCGYGIEGLENEY